VEEIKWEIMSWAVCKSVSFSNFGISSNLKVTLAAFVIIIIVAMEVKPKPKPAKAASTTETGFKTESPTSHS